MKVTKIAVVGLAVAVSLVLTGCTNWEKKYKSLAVEHENLKGLYENCQATSGQAIGMADELSQCRSEVTDLATQLEDCSATAVETGFEGMDQEYDPMTGNITVTLDNAILFAAGKANLKKATISQLDQVVGVLKDKYASKAVDVVGHTDSDPIRKSKWKDNWQLGSERALSVVRYLQKKGVQASLLRGASCSQYRPVGTNKATNRRVEIVVHTR